MQPKRCGFIMHSFCYDAQVSIKFERSRPPSEDERHNMAILRRDFFFAHIKELNQPIKFWIVLCENIAGITWIGYNNLGRMFIFRRAIWPNQELGRTFHQGAELLLSIWSKVGVIYIPRYANPSGDHLNGNGNKV